MSQSNWGFVEEQNVNAWILDAENYLASLGIYSEEYEMMMEAMVNECAAPAIKDEGGYTCEACGRKGFQKDFVVRNLPYDMLVCVNGCDSDEAVAEREEQARHAEGEPVKGKHDITGYCHACGTHGKMIAVRNQEGQTFLICEGECQFGALDEPDQYKDDHSDQFGM